MNRENETARDDFLLLYELSLAIGNSLDLTETCRDFIDVLMSRMNLSYSAVWVASLPLHTHTDTDAAGYELIHAFPEVRADIGHLDADHPSFCFAANQPYRTVTADDPGFDAVVAESGVDGGVYALFNLADIALLKLYSHRDSKFTPQELKQLSTVVEKFTIAIKGAIAHQQVQRESEERAATQRFLDLLLRLSSSFINLPLSEINRSTQEALDEIATSVSADRAYIFDYDAKNGTLSNTFEWCAPGIKPYFKTLQNIPLKEIPGGLTAQSRGELIDIPSVDSLTTGSLRHMLEQHQIKSLLALPLKSKTRCRGFVGFASVKVNHCYGDKDKDLLQLFAQMLVNIAERLRYEKRLKLAASVFSSSREGISITDAEGNILDVNEAFTRITGYGRDEVIGLNPRILKSGRQGAEFYKVMWQSILNKGHWYGEVWNKRKSGEVYAEMLNISAIRDPHGKISNYVALFSDITQQKDHQKQLEHVAHFDALTTLPNRVLLSDRLNQAMVQALRRRQQLAVLFLDLDGFKAVNDAHGHEVGDRLLTILAARMRQALREGDTLARIGGDEFVAVLVDLDDTCESLPLLNRLLAAAAQPVHLGDLTLQISASLGVTFYPQQDEIFAADQLLRQADQAMYQAKLEGKSRYHIFDAEQDRTLRGRHESVEHIQQAFQTHQFLLYYQPKVNMRSGEVVGAEALVRWLHPEQGLKLPDTFLPAIDNHPLSIEMGEWVIDNALTQIEVWRADGLDISVSANVGANQLQQIDFSDRLRKILAAHPAFQPGSLVLEVQETSTLENISHVSRMMCECREMGVTFAMDDFATGYSSLTYLKRLPTSQLKIDQCFVREMLNDSDDMSILKGVLGLASAFQQEAIAEGVETLEHGKVLLQLGCEMAQGNVIAEPMPADDFPAWAAEWQPDIAWRILPPPESVSPP